MGHVLCQDKMDIYSDRTTIYVVYQDKWGMCPVRTKWTYTLIGQTDMEYIRTNGACALSGQNGHILCQDKTYTLSENSGHVYYFMTK